MIVRQEIVLPSTLGEVSFISYHLERSVAFAIRFIPTYRISVAISLLLYFWEWLLVEAKSH